MAQSLAPVSRTGNLNQMVENSSTEGPANSGLSQSVSAEVSATVRSEWNGSVTEERPFTPDANRKKPVVAGNPCAGSIALPNRIARAKNAGTPDIGTQDTLTQKEKLRRSHAHTPEIALRRCRLQARGNPAITPAAPVPARHTYGSQFQADANTAGARGSMADTGTDSASPDSNDRGSVFSGSFPDSTRGTVPASPPDMGAVSPLEWQPRASFGIPDFTSRQFLRPSLRAGRRRGLDGGRARTGVFGRRQTARSSLGGGSIVDSPKTSLPFDQTSVPAIDPSLLSPSDQTSVPALDPSLLSPSNQQ